jgi:spermidine synthase
VQSEVLLSYKNTKKINAPIVEASKAKSSLAKAKKQKALVYNHDLLCNEYQQSMLAGLSLCPKLAEAQSVRALVLGTGAGLLPMFIKTQLGERLSEVVTVDINQDIVQVAKDYFGLVEDAKLKSVIHDAYEYVNESSSEVFDLIFMDINYEDSDLSISPPFKFIETSFLQKLLDMLSPNGYLTFNLITYNA